MAALINHHQIAALLICTRRESWGNTDGRVELRH